jgi:hypothetical protein
MPSAIFLILQLHSAGKVIFCESRDKEIKRLDSRLGIVVVWSSEPTDTIGTNHIHVPAGLAVNRVCTPTLCGQTLIKIWVSRKNKSCPPQDYLSQFSRTETVPVWIWDSAASFSYELIAGQQLWFPTKVKYILGLEPWCCVCQIELWCYWKARQLNHDITSQVM